MSSATAWQAETAATVGWRMDDLISLLFDCDERTVNPRNALH